MRLGLGLGLTQTGGAGGGGLEWLEEYLAPSSDIPQFVIDTENGNYWMDGQEVSFASIVDQSNIDGEINFLEPGVGLHMDNDFQFDILGAAATFIKAGSWTVAVVFEKTPGNASAPLIVTDAGGNVGAAIFLDVNGKLDSNDFDLSGSRQITGPSNHAGPLISVAMTRTDAKIVGSVLGDAVTTDSSPTVSLVGVTTACMVHHATANAGTITLKHMVGWAPQPDSDIPTIATP